MSSRRNFLDADNSIMERNLRFVKNDLEENLNQYFGGTGNSSNNPTAITAPPRDYKVIQPKPDGSHARTQLKLLDNRRGFLLKLGLARHVAYELAKNTYFDVNRYEQQVLQLLDNGIPRDEINNRILFKIRNENNINEDIEQRQNEAGSNMHATTLIPTCCDDQDNLRLNRSGYKESRSSRNRSRSSSRPYDRPWNDLRDECFQPKRSHSTNRDFSPSHERRSEEYFSPEVNFRDEDVRRYPVNRRSRSRTYSSPRASRRDERYQPSRSCSPNTILERRNEDYFREHDNYIDETRRETIRRRSHSYSPKRDTLRIGRYQLSRSRSPQRSFTRNESKEYLTRQDDYRDNIRRNEIDKQYYARPYTPTKNYSRQDRFISSPSRSPDRNLDLIRERTSEGYLQQDNVRDDIRRYAVCDRREEAHYKSSRSRSPTIDFKGNNSEEYFSHHEHFKDRILERSRSPPRHDHREQFYRSTRSRSPHKGFNKSFSPHVVNYRDDIKRNAKYYGDSRETFTSKDKGFKPSPSIGSRHYSVENRNNFCNTNHDSNKHRNIQRHQTSSGQEREMSSLGTTKMFSKEITSFKTNSKRHDIPSLLSLEFPNLRSFQQPSTSAKGNRYNQETNKKPPHQDSKFRNEKNIQQNEKSILRPNKASVPFIKSGLTKPPPGHLKANPKDYWSQWWPQYKYIEYSVPKIDPNDIEVKTCINFMFKPNDSDFRQRANLLVNRAVKLIMKKTLNINEGNYYIFNIYQLFKYKKHLEDPNFQNFLTPRELNCIAPALRQFKKKSTMALLHQSLICKWHTSLNIIEKVQAGEPIKSNYARLLLNEKCFHYLTMESIQELKKLCQSDWPQFNEFYKQIKAEKVDIYSMGVGPNTTLNNYNFVYKHEDIDEDDETWKE